MPNRFLGQSPDFEGDRDATHVAMISVVARDHFKPGEPMGKDGTKNNPVGIVDPFLKKKVLAGDMVWLCLTPGTTTDMKHHWSHPEFPEEEKGVEYYRERLAELLEEIPESPKTLEGFLAYIEEFRNDGVYLHADGFDAYGSIPDEIWDCVKALTGTDHGRPIGFSCSC